MSNGWTGGQYSLVRVVLGVYLAAALVMFAWPTSLAGHALSFVGVGLAGLLALGWRDRWAAAGLLVVWIVLVAWRPGVLLDGAPLLHWAWTMPALLVVHLLLPGAPYGSLDAVGRTDPAGGWRFPPRLFAGLWLGLGAYYLIKAGIVLRDESWRLADALFFGRADAAPIDWAPTMPDALGRSLTWLLLGVWLAFAPLALARRNRRLAWALALGVNLLVLPLAGMAGLAVALAMLHLLAFNPAWLPGTRRREKPITDTIYYDGHCGLCHRWARFVLAEDRTGETFVLAPLDGEHFRRSVPASRRDRLPDSIIVQRAAGELLTRSSAVLYILDRLGGLWRIVACLVRGVPAGLRDRAYDAVAAARRRLFGAPADACPLMPPELRERFRA